MRGEGVALNMHALLSEDSAFRMRKKVASAEFVGSFL